MFFSKGLDGSDLPDKTICLTFDDGPGSTNGDGPGPQTLELATYLYEKRIPATFFVIGTFAKSKIALLKQVSKMGHLIANHTFDHMSCNEGTGVQAAKQIIKTDKIIDKVRTPLRLFRPPYLTWHWTVAGQLNWTAASRDIGPVWCDISGDDWECWQQGQDATTCANKYFSLIQDKCKGIVLMHDSSWEGDIRVNNLTFQTVKILIPQLITKGYTFIRLDSIPQIVDAAKISVIALKAPNGKYVSPQYGGGGEVFADGPSVGAWEPLGLIDLGGEPPNSGEKNIALRCLSGHYLSPQDGGGGIVLANGSAIGNWQKLTLVPCVDIDNVWDKDKFAIRCPNGQYLSAQNGGGGEILANGPAIAAWEKFTVVY